MLLNESNPNRGEVILKAAHEKTKNLNFKRNYE